MNVNEMTRKEIEAVPARNWDEDIGDFRSLVIIPGKSKDLHHSGFRKMDFVAVGLDGEPICRLSGCSDVIAIDGIGGYGGFAAVGGRKRAVERAGWSIDCLPKSGLLHLFCDQLMAAGSALSTFEVYARPKERGEHERD